jgi:hypothetical protein
MERYASYRFRIRSYEKRKFIYAERRRRSFAFSHPDTPFADSADKRGLDAGIPPRCLSK